MSVKYQTKFELSASVIDFDEAQQYLMDADKDMKGMLQGSFPHLSDQIEYIIWRLTNEFQGYIELCMERELDKEESAQISEWISGQNSDGLGEGFECQSFANYLDEDGVDGDEEEFVMASFDWERNEYKLERCE